MMHKYYRFSVLAGMVDDNSDAIAIVSGKCYGIAAPTPVEVRDRIKSAIAPWFKTPTGIAAYALYSEFDLGDLQFHYCSALDELVEKAGIIDLTFQMLESTSDWNFIDSLYEKPDGSNPEDDTYSSTAAAEKDG